MNQEPRPSLDEFLTAPAAVVAAVAPATAMWAPGGSRRQAAREGVPLDEPYVEWSSPQLLDNMALFFRLGIQHLILLGLGPHQFADVGRYAERVVAWTVRCFASTAMIAEYRRRNWRVRMITPSPVPALHEAALYLAQETAEGRHTVWISCIADHNDPWQEILAAIQRSGARTIEDVRQAVYGEAIPPAALLVGFGKPVVGSSTAPPLLWGPNVDCYWTQRAGFRLTEPMLREILYDFAYTRHTWHPGREARFEQATQGNLWDTTRIVGLGRQVSGFWYPQGFPGPQGVE